MKKTDLKIALILTLLSFLAGFFVLPYQLQITQQTMPEQYQLMMDALPFSMNITILISSVQLAVIAFVLSLLGIKLARKTGFSFPILDALANKGKVNINKKALFLAVAIGTLIGFVIVGADKFYFQQRIPVLADTQPYFSLLGLVAGVMYGGIVEEILIRLFVMSLLVWVMTKIRKPIGHVLAVYSLVAIFISSILFALAHLPAAQVMFGNLTSLMFVRILLLNSIGGIFFGYLYWKKGFEYAIFAHMFAHVSMQLLFIPLLY